MPGGAVYSPAMTDFIIMVENSSYMFVGPNVVKTVTNEAGSSKATVASYTIPPSQGVTHLTAQDDLDCDCTEYEIVSYIPQNCEEKVPDLDYVLSRRNTS